MTPSQPLHSADSETRYRARRGLAIYFALLVPLTALFEAIIILIRKAL